MKQIKQLLFLVLLIIPTLAISKVNPDMELVCYGDPILTEAIAAIIDGKKIEEEAFSKEEQTEVEKFFDAQKNKELSKKDKLDSALKACTEGKILRERNKYILNKK